MNPATTVLRRRNAIAITSGSLNVAIGLAVLVGYVAGNQGLITFIPGWAPMRPTTAVALLSAGAAALLLAAGWLKSACAAAVPCGVIGLISLGESLAGAHVPGFDVASLAVQTPARAGALIGCLLIPASAGLILMSGVLRPRARLAVVGAIGSVLFSVGAVAVISYVADVSSAFTLGPYSQLAVHTAAGVAALGAALIRFAWRDSVTDGAGAPAWLPLLAVSGILATTFCLYGALRADEESEFAHEINQDGEGLRAFLHDELRESIQPLIGLARRCSANPHLKREEWDADAQAILSRGAWQAIEWIDATGRLGWANPPGDGDATPDGNAIFEARRKAAVETARSSRQLAVARAVDLTSGGKGAILVLPVFVEDELAGYVAGVFRYHTWFQRMLSQRRPLRVALTIRDGGEKAFSEGVPDPSGRLRQKDEVRMAGIRLGLETSPTEERMRQEHSSAGGAMLVAGGLLAVVFGMLFHLVQRSGAGGMSATPPAAEAPPQDAGTLPVISYGADGVPIAWNQAAGSLFAGVPPPMPRCGTAFRSVHATLMRAGASPASLTALRQVLDSCAQPALLFDADGRFVAANPAAAQALAWPELRIAPSNREALEIQPVLILQGSWNVPPRAAAAQSAG